MHPDALLKTTPCFSREKIWKLCHEAIYCRAGLSSKDVSAHLYRVRVKPTVCTLMLSVPAVSASATWSMSRSQPPPTRTCNVTQIAVSICQKCQEMVYKVAVGPGGQCLRHLMQVQVAAAAHAHLRRKRKNSTEAAACMAIEQDEPPWCMACVRRQAHICGAVRLA